MSSVTFRRVGLSTVTGIVAGFAASPLANAVVTWTFLAVLLIGWALVTVRNRRHGFRLNEHAPMTPDAEMQTRSAVDTWAPSVIAVLPYAALTFGGVIEDEVFGWIWAAAVAVAVSCALIWWTLTTDRTRNIPVPTGQGARTMCRLLLALDAVPSGRQVNRSALIHEAEPLGMSADEVADTIADLAARDKLVVVTERERSGERVDWISLTEAGAADAADTAHPADPAS